MRNVEVGNDPCLGMLPCDQEQSSQAWALVGAKDGLSRHWLSVLATEGSIHKLDMDEGWWRECRKRKLSLSIFPPYWSPMDCYKMYMGPSNLSIMQVGHTHRTYMKILDDFGGLCQVASRMKAHENSWNPWHHVVDGFDSFEISYTSGRSRMKILFIGWWRYVLYLKLLLLWTPAIQMYSPSSTWGEAKSCQIMFHPHVADNPPPNSQSISLSHHQLVPNEPWAVLCFQLQPRISRHSSSVWRVAVISVIPALSYAMPWAQEVCKTEIIPRCLQQFQDMCRYDHVCIILTHSVSV